MAKKIPLSQGPSPEKAAVMLEEGEVRGKKITDRQRKFFGARAGRMVKRGRRPRK